MTDRLLERNYWENARIAIVGSGALGTYYGAMLARAGADVHFLLRNDFSHVREHGLKVISNEGDFELPQVQAYSSAEDIGPCDLVVVALKATANDVLPKVLSPLVKENTTILTLQNGIGNAEFIAEHFGVERLLGGACFVCINRLSPGVVQNFKHGLITLGELQGAPTRRTHDLVELWNVSGVECQLEESLEALLWRKLTWNIPFNGLAIAAGGIDVSHILADEKLLNLAKELMRELIQAAAANGVNIESSFVDFQIDRTAVMGPYRPSSLIDYLAGRAVEVEAIWGEPLRCALAKQVPVPRLEMLYALLSNICCTS